MAFRTKKSFGHDEFRMIENNLHTWEIQSICQPFTCIWFPFDNNYFNYYHHHNNKFKWKLKDRGILLSIFFFVKTAKLNRSSKMILWTINSENSALCGQHHHHHHDLYSDKCHAVFAKLDFFLFMFDPKRKVKQVSILAQLAF